ncbi:unnamed protein product [Cuscuta epithymum]|uniref:Uncharacterized protein n=1 Tax=Cuscuta epithymum TaxID=186058 RepID=A0AAV0CT96_9ASTE|nr:unnamed protein product [Cuscuta epithymum]
MAKLSPKTHKAFLLFMLCGLAVVLSGNQDGTTTNAAVHDSRTTISMGNVLSAPAGWDFGVSVHEVPSGSNPGKNDKNTGVLNKPCKKTGVPLRVLKDGIRNTEFRMN